MRAELTEFTNKGESSSQECAQNFRSLYPAWEQRKIRSGGFGSEVMRVTCAAIAGSLLRNVSCPSSRIAGELLPSRREAAAERLRVGNRVVEKEVAGAPAFRLKGPFRHQRPPAPARHWRWNTPAGQRPRRRTSGRKRPRRRSHCSATRHRRRARQSRNPRGRGWLWRLC